MSEKARYMREGRGVCKICARELDVVVPHVARGHYPGGQVIGMEAVRWGPQKPVIARHLNRIEEYGPKGASPSGFCSGSLTEFNPVRTPEPTPRRR